MCTPITLSIAAPNLDRFCILAENAVNDKERVRLEVDGGCSKPQVRDIGRWHWTLDFGHWTYIRGGLDPGCWLKSTHVILPICRGGGMADATDLKSVVRKDVRVRLPPSAPIISIAYSQ